MGKLKFTKSYVSILAIILLIMAVFIVPTLRSEGKGQIGTEAYFYMRIAENPSLTDTLSYGGRFAAYELGLPSLLSWNIEFLSNWLPAIFGIMTFALFYLILRKMKIKNWRISLVMLVISPTFIYLFTTLNKYAPAIVLVLASFYLMNQKNNISKIFAGITALLLPLFSLAIAMIYFIMLIFLVIFKKEKTEKIFSLIALGTALLINLVYFMIKSGIPRYVSLNNNGSLNIINRLFSDLGGVYGLSIFAIFLTIFGLSNIWKTKYQNPGMFLIMLFLTMLIFFTPIALFPLMFFIAIFSAKGVKQLLTKKWSSIRLRNFTLLILICGLLFSTVSYINVQIDAEPSTELLGAIALLEQKPEGVTFSDYKNGHYITYAGKQNIMDEQTLFSPDLKERIADSQKLLDARVLEDAQGLIDKYQIKYFLLDNRMRKEIWEGDEEAGLQFLLTYGTESFTKIYSENGATLWEVKN